MGDENSLLLYVQHRIACQRLYWPKWDWVLWEPLTKLPVGTRLEGLGAGYAHLMTG